MHKDQVNSVVEQVIETVYTDPIDATAYREGLVQFETTLVDVNTNLTTLILQVIAETLVDGETWQAVDYDSGEKTDTFAAAFAPLLNPTTDLLGLYLRYKILVGGTGYELEAVDPDDNAYWDVTIKSVLWN